MYKEGVFQSVEKIYSKGLKRSVVVSGVPIVFDVAMATIKFHVGLANFPYFLAFRE